MAFRRQVKNLVKHYSDAEIKVREATSNDPWGPSSSLMLAISDLTFNTISLSEIMHMLWQRLGDHGRNWRHVYKSLTLMDYLIKNGSKKVIQHCREGFCNLQMLKDFQHIDEAGKDQGHYIREKSKQVITLLMDEQLLYQEREVASWTRQRTSYSMRLPSRFPGAGKSPTGCTSVLIAESPASEKKHSLLKIASLRNKKNTSKARLKQELCQDVPLPAGTAPPRDSPQLRTKTWKSTEFQECLMRLHRPSPAAAPVAENNPSRLISEAKGCPELPDLTLLHGEYPNQLLPTNPPSITTPASWLSEGEADIGNLWDADAVSAPSGKSPSMQTNMNLDKRLEKAIANTATETPSQILQEKQEAAEHFETLTPLPAFWPRGQEEFISLSLRMSESESTFHGQSSVETLYASPSFKAFSPETATNKDLQTAAQPSISQMDDGSLKPLAMQIPATSEGASSFSTSSVSSPDSAHPEKSGHRLPPVLTGPSFWTLSQPQSSSASSKYRDKAARVPHAFLPMGAASSDDEECSHLSLPENLPDNSNSATKKPAHVASRDQVEFSTPTVDHLLSCANFQTMEGLPGEPESSGSIRVLLGEVKSAVVRLHEDLSLVIQELSVISSHLGSLSRSHAAAGKGAQIESTHLPAVLTEHCPKTKEVSSLESCYGDKR